MTHTCIICNKNYASYKSHWNHVKKFHKNINNEQSKCNKLGSTINDAKSLDSNTNIDNSLIIKELKQEILDMKLIIEEMNNKFNNTKKINNNNNNNNNTINNIINNNNNNYIIGIGNENLDEVFSRKEKLDILRRGYSCLDYLIEYVHFNENYPQFKNILITNLQNKLAYKYDEDKKIFITISKDKLLEDIISERMYNINTFYDELKKILDVKKSEIISNFIKTIENDNDYEKNKKNDIKLIIYNNKNKINKDLEIAL